MKVCVPEAAETDTSNNSNCENVNKDSTNTQPQHEDVIFVDDMRIKDSFISFDTSENIDDTDSVRSEVSLSSDIIDDNNDGNGQGCMEDENRLLDESGPDKESACIENSSMMEEHWYDDDDCPIIQSPSSIHSLGTISGGDSCASDDIIRSKSAANRSLDGSLWTATRRRGNTKRTTPKNTPKRPQVMKKRRQGPRSLRWMADSSRSTRHSEAGVASAPASLEKVIVLGADISHLSSTNQFLVCASGVIGFNLSFGYLQEFVAVEICNRNLGLFLALMQFSGYTLLSYLMRNVGGRPSSENAASSSSNNNHINNHQSKKTPQDKSTTIRALPSVPGHLYASMGVLSALDMAMTNMAMHYINYPAKTLMKSSRVVFTMIFGVLMAGKQYRLVDYAVVLCMVAGLAIFMQADATSDAIFEPLGVFMLTISLLCDGATNIMSETIMKTYNIGQDELIFRMYSLGLVALTSVALMNGDLVVGLMWITQPGTYDEWMDGDEEISWNVIGKVIMILLFSGMGFFGSSCSAAITKNFGALTMSITSTARRALTLFISFFLFDNECTIKHVAGVIIFIVSLIAKSLLSKSKTPKQKIPMSPPPVQQPDDVERQARAIMSGEDFSRPNGLGRR